MSPRPSRLDPQLPPELDSVLAVEYVDKAWRELRQAIIATGDHAAIDAAVRYSARVLDFERLRPALLDRAAAWQRQRISRQEQERIRDRQRRGERVSELAAEYQVTPSRIYQICAEGE